MSNLENGHDRFKLSKPNELPRKQVYTRESVSVGAYDSLKEWKREIDRLIDTFGEHVELTIDYDEYNNEVDINVEYKREETDEEYKKRVDAMSRFKERELKELERLIKKHGIPDELTDK